MKIAVYGASGFVGRLVVDELARRRVDVTLAGRHAEPLEEIAARYPEESMAIEVAELDDAAALEAAFRGCDVVISCLAPYIVWGEPIVRAAIAAGCHYVDTTGEPLFVRKLLDTYDVPARTAGVSIVPAATDDTFPASFLAQMVADRTGPLRALTMIHGTFDADISRGTLRSLLEIAKNPPVVYADGEWRDSAIEPLGTYSFPDTEGPTATFRCFSADVYLLPRHVSTAAFDVGTNFAPEPGAASLTEEMVAAFPMGPDVEKRTEARFCHLAIAQTHDGQEVRAHIRGTDLYNLTAIIAVEAAVRLSSGKAPSGVLAPAEAFDARDFVESLGEQGVQWAFDDGAA